LCFKEIADLEHAYGGRQGDAEEDAEETPGLAPLLQCLLRPQSGTPACEILPQYQEVEREAEQQDDEDLQAVAIGFPQDGDQSDVGNKCRGYPGYAFERLDCPGIEEAKEGQCRG